MYYAINQILYKLILCLRNQNTWYLNMLYSNYDKNPLRASSYQGEGCDSIGLEGDKWTGSTDLQPVLVNLPDYVLCQFIENIIMPVYVKLMSIYNLLL